MQPLERIIDNRRWWYREYPFRHFRASNVFVQGFYNELEGELLSLLARGFGEPGDPRRFSRNMMYSDAYAWDFPPQIGGPLAVFYSREWKELLVGLTRVAASPDVNGALHHHPRASRNGSVHRDLSACWFSTQTRPDGINPMDLKRCSYIHGPAVAHDAELHEVVRAVTMIFYLGNTPWSPGDGGETGLYRSPDQPVDAPCVHVPPRNNSILIFENSPFSYHSFIKNQRHIRNSVILWLHRPKADAVAAWGPESLFDWRRRHSAPDRRF